MSSSNRFNNCEKLIIASSVTKGVYLRPCILLIKHWTLDTLIIRYFQNKDIDSNQDLQKRHYTNGSIKKQPFLNRGSNKLLSSGSLSSSMLPISSWKLKIIAYRDSATTPSSSKLELPDIILSRRAPPYLMWKCEIGLWFVCL